MKLINRFLVIITLAVLFISCNSKNQELFFTNSPRSKILFDTGWKFFRGTVADGEIINLDDSLWRTVDLPHDWSIEDLPGTNSPFDSLAPGGIDAGYLVRGTAWYRKEFEVPVRLNGKKIFIDFEGVYMNADVWLNGEHLGSHPYGYTEFGFEISDKIHYGEKNVLAIEVKNEGRNSRWYTGSGIYRHVWLTITNPLYFEKWSTKITTPDVSESSASISIETNVLNQTKTKMDVNIVATIFKNDGTRHGSVETQKSIEPFNSLRIKQNLVLTEPELWSPDSPELYSAVLEIIDSNSKLIDSQTIDFGIRSMEFSIDKGFILNGNPTLLKGACMHHGNGPLGAAAYNRAEERRVELMKASGFNAIRCSHNPPSTAFLDACDRLGMLVIDETFDMWRYQKNPQDYHLYFDEWWQRDVDAMVKRDWNHPSIIMWSIGNEIPERGNLEGVETSKMLVDYVKSLDNTRPVTAAVNGLGPDKDPYFATLDIAGYNYSFGGDHGQQSIFEKDQERVPGRIAYCSESYPLEAFGAWMEAVDYPYVLGDFVWTGFDYLGEASIGWLGYPHDSSFYPWNHAFCGDIDICGLKRPQSYYRDVLWNNGNQLSVFVKPPLPSFPGKVQRIYWSKWHWQDVVPLWNWEGFEGQELEVEVYCAYKSVELFLNGEPLGKKQNNRENQWITKWMVPYQAGELKAVAYTDDGSAVTSKLNTSGKPVQIKLKADRTEIITNGQDMSYITVELQDENGITNPGAENILNFEVEGPGIIIAVANSNPMSVESFQANQRKAWKGKALIIVKTEKNKAGEIRLIAKSEGLKKGIISLNSK